MASNILDLVDSAGEVSTAHITTQQEIAHIHRDLLDAAASRGDEYRRAASMVHTLSMVLETFPASDPRLIDRVVVHVVCGLRRGPLRPGLDCSRFDDAQGWLNQLRIEGRATRAAPAARG